MVCCCKKISNSRLAEFFCMSSIKMTFISDYFFITICLTYTILQNTHKSYPFMFIGAFIGNQIIKLWCILCIRKKNYNLEHICIKTFFFCIENIYASINVDLCFKNKKK